MLRSTIIHVCIEVDPISLVLCASVKKFFPPRPTDPAMSTLLMGAPRIERFGMAMRTPHSEILASTSSTTGARPLYLFGYRAVPKLHALIRGHAPLRHSRGGENPAAKRPFRPQNALQAPLLITKHCTKGSIPVRPRTTNTAHQVRRVGRSPGRTRKKGAEITPFRSPNAPVLHPTCIRSASNLHPIRVELPLPCRAIAWFKMGHHDLTA